MASVFTFESEPPKLSSPWGPIAARLPRLDPSIDGLGERMPQTASSRLLAGLVTPPPLALAQCGVTRLETEPQEGPTEYKLHLLLRQRRSYLSVSTSDTVAGSQRGRAIRSVPERSAVSEPAKRSRKTPASPQPTAQLRQNRLQHLTTQLLWRLQQSSPYHSSSAVSLVIPRLPEATPKLGVPLRPEKLIPGLESSRGALYEIGVADDGSFVGLTRDEMDESLTNLRAMAASLGCNVEILRFVVVGDCEWHDVQATTEVVADNIRKEPVFVVEAKVFPESDPHFLEESLVETRPERGFQLSAAHHPDLLHVEKAPENVASQTQQLRVSLTGRTTAGKSSLIGTISTSTLDNGRGKSRLSLLKHRHEIATGITSSVAPELIGYTATDRDEDLCEAVINYNCGNISSWNDVHNAAGDGRLILLTDSAGHPRYRRTIVRGLVSWAPHWTLCCIPADENLRGSIGDIGRPIVSDVNDREDIARSSLAHLVLCLKLKLRLVVVITKQDRATKEGLRQCLSVVLTMIKASGRKPNLLVRPNITTNNPHGISVDDELAAKKAFSEPGIVPIILTSAVSGNGIGQLHALLKSAPIPELAPPKAGTPTVLFHIDELYSLSHNLAAKETDPDQLPCVVSGYLHYGQLSVGEFVIVGPFIKEAHRESVKQAPQILRTRSIPSRLSAGAPPWLSQSMPQSESHEVYTPPPSTPTPAPSQGEFHMARVVSIRNLRLPLRTLLQDQVATIGIEFPHPNESLTSKLRKGMILARASSQEAPSPTMSADYALRSCVSIQVRFNEEDYEIMEPGAIFNVYVASVRAVAKILTVEAVSRDSFNPFLLDGADDSAEQGIATTFQQNASDTSVPNDDFADLEENFEAFGLRSEEDIWKGRRMIDVVFSFLYNPEWIEVGARVLGMPSQALAGGIGLDGFVGYVIEVRD